MDFNKLTGQERCDHRRSQVSFSKAGQLHQAARGLHIAAGEFCLLTEALNFGQKPFLPLKHRIRNAASLEDL